MSQVSGPEFLKNSGALAVASSEDGNFESFRAGIFQKFRQALAEMSEQEDCDRPSFEPVFWFHEGARTDNAPRLPDFHVKPPFDGRPATPGNGTMVAFEARGQAQVRALHAAALAAGGSDEGAPGFCAAYGVHFYVGYLRDPQGNKIALYSDNPHEPGRDD